MTFFFWQGAIADLQVQWSERTAAVVFPCQPAIENSIDHNIRFYGQGENYYDWWHVIIESISKPLSRTGTISDGSTVNVERIVFINERVVSLLPMSIRYISIEGSAAHIMIGVFLLSIHQPHCI